MKINMRKIMFELFVNYFFKIFGEYCHSYFENKWNEYLWNTVPNIF